MGKPVGRKIGFTNRGIWKKYGVHQPIWGTVYDDTLIQARDGAASVPLAGLAHPRIEPEICFKLRAAPPPAATVDELLACIDWVAHSIEIVQYSCGGSRSAPTCCSRTSRSGPSPGTGSATRTSPR